MKVMGRSPESKLDRAGRAKHGRLTQVPPVHGRSCWRCLRYTGARQGVPDLAWGLDGNNDTSSLLTG